MKINSKGALWGIIAGGAVLVAVIALVIVEFATSGRLHIVNNTGRNIENISVVFFDNEQSMNVDHLFEGSVKAGDKINFKYDGYYDFTGMDCTCDVDVKFEGYDSILVYDGVFYTVFKGSIDLIFTEEDGEYYITMKAYEGLFKSTRATGLDSKFRLDLEGAFFEDEEGFWDFQDDFDAEDIWEGEEKDLLDEAVFADDDFEDEDDEEDN